MATNRSMAALEVKNVEVSHAFYLRLGFGTLGVWEPGNVGTAIVQRGDVTIMLQRANIPSINSGLAVYVYVDDPDILHEEYLANGIKNLSGVENAFYGCREFEIIDPDGHHIMFGKDLNEPPYNVGLGPDRGKG